MSSSQGGEDHREAGNKDSDGGESGNVTDEISHWSLLTRYVPTLFSFCSIVNRVLLILLLLMFENRLRFRPGKWQAADSKEKKPGGENTSGSEKDSKYGERVCSRRTQGGGFSRHAVPGPSHKRKTPDARG
ncbi:hypothetical protein F3P66_07850 [Agrobacterium fabrum]|uniref:Uncharacterized protein n=1 Tax=Agrobacterium fabrum (strain C58 / ATCC 33970) TaxID=176299 RepID=Q8UFV6_AGRFC|nr:hypothetical protein Atu1291 [Agrobacterium fabrum str. C58]QRM59370.1 hypothetical protein F3P66_07850 [Agrobacterium fabrum]TRB30789.1 hypothetical protein EXN51_00990 [Agrobacterium fabrum]